MNVVVALQLVKFVMGLVHLKRVGTTALGHVERQPNVSSSKQVSVVALRLFISLR